MISKTYLRGVGNNIFKVANASSYQRTNRFTNRIRKQIMKHDKKLLKALIRVVFKQTNKTNNRKRSLYYLKALGLIRKIDSIKGKFSN